MYMSFWIFSYYHKCMENYVDVQSYGNTPYVEFLTGILHGYMILYPELLIPKNMSPSDGITDI